MAYYNYKRVANRADFISATVEWSEQTGEEFEGTADYDGDVYCVAEFLLDKKDEEIARLRAELAECRARIDGLEADLAKTIGLLSKTAEIVCMDQLADVPAAVERLQADYRYMSNEYAALAGRE